MKASIIGLGKVGSTLAFALTMKNVLRELVLVGRDQKVLQGEALDLDHAQSFVPSPAKIRAGEMDAAEGSDIIAVCASVPTPSGMDDRALLGPANARLFDSMIPTLAEGSPNAIFLIVSNPVDVLTYHTLKLTGLPASRVLGTGTLIDSVRYRRMLSEELGIHGDDLRAYILGEHGESQFAAMSCASAGAEPIEDTPHRRQLFAESAAAGITIFRHKGYTNYGIALAAATIIEAIVQDEKHTLPVSTLIEGYCDVRDVCLSLPAVIGNKGIERVLFPKLNDAETAAFRKSADRVREQIVALKQ